MNCTGVRAQSFGLAYPRYQPAPPDECDAHALGAAKVHSRARCMLRLSETVPGPLAGA